MDAKEPRWTTAEDAVRTIRSGSRVFVGSGCAEPQTLVRALCAQKDAKKAKMQAQARAMEAQ